jgi:hypothetical protein
MGDSLTREQVLGLAPDGASAKAATGLVSENNWVMVGADDGAAWGECKGSGAKPYQTQVDLAALAAKCSCPSRKFPCKHGLALLLIYSQRAPFPVSNRPVWVDEWQSARKDKVAKKEQAATEKTPADQAAADATAAKREAARWTRIETGSADLQRWIADQFRRGLGQFGQEQHKEWTAMAARMVDAQAPGLGTQLLEALAARGARSAGHEEAIETLGLIQLANAGIARRAQLSPSRLADLRIAVGWPHDKEDVVASADAVDDDWLVLGQVVIARDKGVSERRVWLRGSASGRDAVLLDFAFSGKNWGGFWVDGMSYRAVLKFYPGSVPLRAVATSQNASQPHCLPLDTPAMAVDQASQRYADNPWLQQVPLLLTASIPARRGQDWILHTAAGVFSLLLPNAAAWSLLAYCGGKPVDVMGEWNGRVLRPLAASDAAQPKQRWSLGTIEVDA